MRRLGCLILVAAAVIAVLLAGNFLYGWTASGPLEQKRTISIKSGSSLAMAAEAMEAEGVIKSAETFVNRAKILGGSEPIKAGEFEIPAGASNAQILDILQGGKSVQRLITVPEGTPSIIVYEKLMAAKLLKGDIPVPAEGSILPDSYSFERGEQRAAALQRMQKAIERKNSRALAYADKVERRQHSARSNYSGGHRRKGNGTRERTPDCGGCLQQPYSQEYDAAGRSHDHLSDHQGKTARPSYPPIRNRAGKRL